MNRKNLVSYLINKIGNPSGKIFLTLITLLCSNLPAQAASFNITYDEGVNSHYKSAGEFAAMYWEKHLLDDVTINIHLDVANSSHLPDGVLGAAIPSFENDVLYSDFKTALTNDRRSSNDYTAVANLPGISRYDFMNYYANEIQNGTMSDDTHWALGIANADSATTAAYNGTYVRAKSDITLTRANAKSLGLINGHSSDLDGTIVLSNLANTGYNWQFRRNHQANSSKFDLTTVLIHEIGHILGFVNGVDAINQNNVNDTTFKLSKHATPMNVFSSVDLSNTAARQVYGEDSYFSIDGGVTNLGYWSTGADTNLALGLNSGGDGNQASHPDVIYTDAVMNPLLALGQRRNLIDFEKMFMDVIGWDLRINNNSDSTLQAWADNRASTKGNNKNTYALDKMFNQFRWGGASSGGTFQQGMDVAQHLADQGFFQQGAFFSHMPKEAASVPEPTSIMSVLGFGLLGLGLRRKRNVGR